MVVGRESESYRTLRYLVERRHARRDADALGRPRRPRLSVPLLTPRLSSLWIGLVTPVDTGVVRPLIESLRASTTVTDPSGAELFPISPQPFARALRSALAVEPSA
jgi:hypothetical protein